MQQATKVALIILDGWGHGKGDHADVIHKAHTPFIDQLYQKYPHAQLRTDGQHVGLPEGQMGNSEVGHLNIGAGRIVYQDLGRIHQAIADGSFAANQVLNKALDEAKASGKKVHFAGLLSDGGIHSHQQHLFELCNIAKQKGLTEVLVHAFTDGRDTDPNAAINYVKKLEGVIADGPVRLASIIGRYYAMDRDKRWERISKAYQLLVHGKGQASQSATAAIQASYDAGITDEFIEPIVLTDDSGNPLGTIEEGDTVICFNFRTDRCRQLTIALTQEDFPDQEMKRIPLQYVTMTNYDSTFEKVAVLFEKDNLQNTLGEVLAKAGKSQIRIAETEKYPHVTFFFSGGREAPFEGEKRILVNSPKVATYDLQPEMSAAEVTDRILQEIETQSSDFICLNFANPDMVGHTGVYSAIKTAVEYVDQCAKKIIEKGLENDYSFIVIADHGNADFAVNKDGSPNTAHTTNPVPVVIIDPNATKVQDGILADVAPTVLHLLNVPQPNEMSGKVLVTDERK